MSNQIYREIFSQIFTQPEVWKFKNFTVTQILREIKSKTCRILQILIEFLQTA